MSRRRSLPLYGVYCTTRDIGGGIRLKRSMVKSKRYSSWTELGRSIGWTQNRYVRVWCRDIEKGRCATFRYALTWLVQDEQERDKIGTKPCRDCSQLDQVELYNPREMKNDEWRFWTPYEPWMGVLAQWEITQHDVWCFKKCNR